MKDKKSTRGFQLDPMPEPVTVVFNKKENQWYPTCKGDTNEIFIYGKGRIKIGKWKKEVIQPLSNPFTAKELKAVKDQYGYHAAMGMIQGWGAYSLFDDQSIGLSYTKFEIYNMADLGEEYDEFTDDVQIIGDNFIQGLLNHEFRMEGKCLWIKDNLVGFTDIYEKIRLHPLLHLDHSVGDFSFMSRRMLPVFNPITFDDMLVMLFNAKYQNGSDYKKADKMLAKYVSVYDRIKHLTTKAIADSFHTIFKLNEKLTIPETHSCSA